MTVVIFEGGAGVGKSTIGKMLESDMSKVIFINPPQLKISNLSEYVVTNRNIWRTLNKIFNKLEEKLDDVILIKDRFLASEYAYGKLTNRIQNKTKKLISKIVEENQLNYIFFDISKENVKKRLIRRGEHPSKAWMQVQFHDSLNKFYQEFFEKYNVRQIKINVNKQNKKETKNEVKGIIENNFI